MSPKTHPVASVMLLRVEKSRRIKILKAQKSRIACYNPAE
jgi:hypothetical protein